MPYNPQTEAELNSQFEKRFLWDVLNDIIKAYDANDQHKITEVIRDNREEFLKTKRPHIDPRDEE